MLPDVRCTRHPHLCPRACAQSNGIIHAFALLPAANRRCCWNSFKFDWYWARVRRFRSAKTEIRIQIGNRCVSSSILSTFVCVCFFSCVRAQQDVDLFQSTSMRTSLYKSWRLLIVITTDMHRFLDPLEIGCQAPNARHSERRDARKAANSRFSGCPSEFRHKNHLRSYLKPTSKAASNYDKALHLRHSLLVIICNFWSTNPNQLTCILIHSFHWIASP